MTALPSASVLDDPQTEGTFRSLLIEAMLAFMAELLGGAASSELTIAAGSVTPTRAIHSIDTEADASTDDLTNIALTNHPDGRPLIIYAANGGRTVKVKNSAGGSGQIVLAAGADYDLDETYKTIVLRRDGTQWVEVALNPGTPAAWRSYLGLAIGSSVQAWDDLLDAIAAISTAGMLARTGDGTAAVRTITAGTGIGVTNGSGVSGNPTIAITDAELLALAGVTSAADRLFYFTGSGSGALATFTSAARTFVAAVDAAAQRTAIGVKSMSTRDVTISTSAPSGGADGDVWLRYA